MLLVTVVLVVMVLAMTVLVLACAIAAATVAMVMVLVLVVVLRVTALVVTLVRPSVHCRLREAHGETQEIKTYEWQNPIRYISVN